MSTPQFLASTGFVISFLAVAALLELVVPLFAHRHAGEARRRANLTMTAVTLLFNWALLSVAGAVAVLAPENGPQLFARAGMPAAVQAVAGIFVLDFGFGYLAHRLMHASPLLWRIHRVHHSDAFVDATTSYRTHPAEGVWRHLFMLAPIWLLGIPATVVAVYRAISIANAIFEHANVRVPAGLDSRLTAVWVTPNMHKVHHSRDARETDSNYGNILSLHDRLLGTFTPSERAANVVYGLDDVPDAQNLTAASLISMPFARDGQSTAGMQVEA
jgi:sterol desaturase/sphingolipid hydroxylase (fatty acid hydroxylase superfamily)